jgi:hypothetical protein
MRPDPQYEFNPVSDMKSFAKVGYRTLELMVCEPHFAKDFAIGVSHSEEMNELPLRSTQWHCHDTLQAKNGCRARKAPSADEKIRLWGFRRFWASRKNWSTEILVIHQVPFNDRICEIPDIITTRSRLESSWRSSG